MNVLGWQILDEGDYRVDVPALSREEKELIAACEERFKEASRHSEAVDEGLLEGILLRTAEELGMFLSREQEGYLPRVALMHIYGSAFLEELLQDPDIEEISVIGPRRPVYAFSRDKGWMRVNASFDDERSIADMINRLARPLGRHITLQNPRLDAALPDGSRLHASLPPISLGEMTIRKFRERPYSPLELSMNGTLPIEALPLLSVLMQSDCSLMIAGNTASGKTTTLNALFSFVPSGERVVIAEETPEINIPHLHQMRLVANKEMGISLKDLVYDSLRMRPDRMIVGEVRGREEAEALLDVLLAGQARGSYATFHAQSAQEALSRLRSFGIDEMDLKSLDCIIVQRRMLLYDPKKRESREVRRVIEIAEFDGTLRPLYSKGKLREDSALLERAAEGFGLSMKEMGKELARRKRLISKAGQGHQEFYECMQEQLFGGC